MHVVSTFDDGSAPDAYALVEALGEYVSLRFHFAYNTQLLVLMHTAALKYTQHAQRLTWS